MKRMRKTFFVAIAVALLAGCEPATNVRRNDTQGSESVPVPLPEGAPIVISDLPPEDRAPLGKTPIVNLGPEADVLTSGQVLDRLRARLIQPACIVGPNNTRWRHKYAGYPQHFADQITAILPRMLVVLDQLEARKLPAEFAVVPIVESWYRIDIGTSFAGAVGMWQFLAQTARNNGGTVTADFDGRKSMLDSTLAAMNYLDALQSMFNDWRLASMAYNSGEYRLAKTMTSDELAARGAGSVVRYRRPGGLAFETYEYVSKMRALICLLDQPQRQGIPLDPTVPITHWVPLTVPAGIDTLDELANRLGIDAQTLKDFNGGYRNGLIGADAPRTLLVPAATRPRWAALMSPPSEVAGSPPTPMQTPASPAAGISRPPPAQILLPPMPPATKPVAAPSAEPSLPATPVPTPTTISRPAASGTNLAPAAGTGATTSAQSHAATIGNFHAPATSKPPAPTAAPTVAPQASRTTPPNGDQKPAMPSLPAPESAPSSTPAMTANPAPPPPLPRPPAVTPLPPTATAPPPAVVVPAPSSVTPSPPAPLPASASQPARNPAAPATVPALPSASNAGGNNGEAVAAPSHPPRTYKVELGDSLDSIATRFGVTTADLRQWNHLSIDATLYVDQVIQLEP